MTLKKPLFLVLGLLHFSFIIPSSARINPIPDNRLGEYILAPLLHSTGADNAYGYFAPGVASELHVSLTFEGREGNTWSTSFQDLFSLEGGLRAKTSVLIFGVQTEPESRSPIAASWAAWGLGKYPEATQVRIEIDVTQLPNMARYRAGEPIGHRNIYSAVFHRPNV
jgi:hypothetical protein